MVIAAMPIIKKSYAIDDALELFEKQGMQDKIKMMKFRRSSVVNVYALDGYYDYYYGYMVPDASYLPYFELHLYGEGFVIQMPEAEAPTVVPPFEPQDKLFQVLNESTKWGKMLGVQTVADLNEDITKGRIQETILVQEALQEKKIAEIAQMIVERSNVKFILIAGPSSSGKTTFSHRLSIQLKVNNINPVPISLDDYFVNREDTPLDEFGKYDFESIYAVDLDLFNSDLEKLLKGEEIDVPKFNFKTGKREYSGRKLKIKEDQLIILEGIHALNPILTQSISEAEKFKIYISVLTQINLDDHNRIPTTDLRLIRRIVRDYNFRGYSAARTIEHWDAVRRGEEKNIFPYQEEADVMFNSACIYELPVLKKYAKPLLEEIKEDAKSFIEANRVLKLLQYFVELDEESDIPPTSIVREFIGGSRIVD